MKILIIDQLDQYILDLCLNLTKSLGISTVVEKEKSKINLDIDENFLNVAIFNESLFGKEQILEVYRDLKKQNPNIQIISRFKGENNEQFLDLKMDKNLEIIGKFVPCADNNHPTNFKPINIATLLNINMHNIGCDLYIKMLKNGEDHYVKRLYAKDQFSKDEIIKYKNLGLKEFFVSDNQFETFINVLTIELINMYQSELESNLNLISLYDISHEIINERIKLNGVDELSNLLINEYIKSVLVSIKNETEFNLVLNKICKKEINEDFAQCYIISIIMHQFAIQQEWQSETSKEFTLYLSLFHDIALFNRGLSKINSKTKIESLNENERRIVEKHAKASADIVSKFNSIPFGLTQMIREHHGSKDGIGIPETLSINISPMLSTFIIIEDFTIELIEIYNRVSTPEEINHKKVLPQLFRKMEKNYQKLVFQKSLQDLQEVFIKIFA